MIRQKNNNTKPQAFSLLLLEIPRTNDKKELAAEQMFAALHGILRPYKELWKEGLMQERISFEIASINKQIRFFVWVPTSQKNFVEGQIYAQYPTAQIHELSEDYASRELSQPILYSSELILTDHETIPIKTFTSFEVDPLASVTATLAKLDEVNEEMWIQVIVRPISDEWHKKGVKEIQRIKGKTGLGIGSILGQAITALAKPPTYEGVPSRKELTDREKSRISAIEEKGNKLGFQVKIRILYAGNNEETAKLRMQAIVGTFKQFNSTNLNGFQSKYASFDRNKLAEFRARHFIDKGFILNIEELASLYHLPHTSVETPNIVWATAKTSEPPANLPAYGKHKDEEVSLFGSSNFRGDNTVFGALRSDRSRHVYVLGQTGTGKSKLLELLTLSDIYYDKGFAIIDPHGDYALTMLGFIPERRMKDVIYFNPADRDFPMGFNPLEVYDPMLKSQISSELVGVMKRMFDSWGPRLEYILRYTLLALLDYPNATMLDITRMLTDKRFRNDVIDHCEDLVVKNFWTIEFASWNEKFATEAVAPVLNKVGAFTANPLIRNIIGQPKSSFNIRKIMDEGKILIVNLSRGIIGEDNAALLGSMFVTKIQLAAMSRADIPRMEDRTPFYLYVDEFQNFATDSFAVILSEARKFGLCLTVANQYINQMEDTVKDAVFGNVGTMITGRVGPEDASYLVKYYEPQFNASDIIQLANRDFLTSMTIAGEKAPAFSFRSLAMPETQQNNSDAIIQLAHEKYTKPRNEVEDIIIKANELDKSNSKQPDTPPNTHKTTAERYTAPLIGIELGSAIDNNQPQINNTKKKRKRTRSRRKNIQQFNGQSMDAVIINPQNRSNEDGATIHLR